MRNRNLISKRLEQLEIKMVRLERIPAMNEPLSAYRKEIEATSEIIAELKSMIEAEPFSPNEFSRKRN